MAFDLLPTLRPRQWRVTICVRVCRKWEYRGSTDDGPIQHVDLVLVDAKGNGIYAEIPVSEVGTKSPLLHEGGIYVISRFRVSNAKSAYRPVDSPYMVEFTLHTTVSAARDDMPDFPKYAYKITPIHDLSTHTGDTKNFVDTIGLLVEMSDTHTVRLPNKPAPTLTWNILRDLSCSEVKITLWGQRAAAFNIDAVYDRAEARLIVVLFVGGLMKSFQGNCYLSANAASRWYFNPWVPEVRQFHDGLQDQRIDIRFVHAPVNQQGQQQIPPPLEEKTLQQLNGMDPYEFSESGYRCTVTVGRLTPNASWWFPSCTKCSKSCVPDGTGYRCSPCGNTLFKFKYKICFIASDGTDEAEVICFGDIARRIIRKSVQQVLRTATIQNAYPPDITKIVNQRFTFAVVLTHQSYYRHQKTYQVSSVITSYGNRDAAPVAPAPVDGGAAADLQIQAPPADGTDEDPQHMSPHSVKETDLSSQSVENTPPPAIELGDTPPLKGHKSGSGKGVSSCKETSVRRKLDMDRIVLQRMSMAGNELALTMLQHRRVARSAHGPLGAAILPGWNSPDLPSREDFRPFFFCCCCGMCLEQAMAWMKNF